MHKIQFSHEYTKMPVNVDTAILLEVLTATKEELSSSFLEYDTAYFEQDPFTTNLRMVKKNYPLPKGKLIVLILNSSSGFGNYVWITIRRHTPEKEAYYRSIRGQQVEIVVKSMTEFCPFHPSSKRDPVTSLPIAGACVHRTLTPAYGWQSRCCAADRVLVGCE